MNSITIVCLVGLTTSLLFALSQATVGGQYSVNVHFVPPLVTAPCTIAQFWAPANVTCAMCFCMTGTLSRCIPQPGCNPIAPNNGTTPAQNSSMPMPAPGGDMMGTPAGMGNETSVQPASNGTATGSGGGQGGSGGGSPASEGANTETGGGAPPAGESGGGGGGAAESKRNEVKVRRAKPGRRRRHSVQSKDTKER